MADGMGTVEVPATGRFLVLNGQVIEAVEERAHLENVGLGCQAYVIHNGIHHVLYAAAFKTDCRTCQVYTSKARADSGDLTAEASCPKHTPAEVPG